MVFVGMRYEDENILIGIGRRVETGLSAAFCIIIEQQDFCFRFHGEAAVVQISHVHGSSLLYQKICFHHTINTSETKEKEPLGSLPILINN